METKCSPMDALCTMNEWMNDCRLHIRCVNTHTYIIIHTYIPVHTGGTCMRYALTHPLPPSIMQRGTWKNEAVTTPHGSIWVQSDAMPCHA